MKTRQKRHAFHAIHIFEMMFEIFAGTKFWDFVHHPCDNASVLHLILGSMQVCWSTPDAHALDMCLETSDLIRSLETEKKLDQNRFRASGLELAAFFENWNELCRLKLWTASNSFQFASKWPALTPCMGEEECGLTCQIWLLVGCSVTLFSPLMVLGP